MYTSGDLDRPRTFTARVTSSPAGPIEFEWFRACHRGIRSRDVRRKTTGTTPFTMTIRPTLRRASNCYVSISATVPDQPGTIDGRLYGKKRPKARRHR